MTLPKGEQILCCLRKQAENCRFKSSRERCHLSFHLYWINELYSSADASIQFIELSVGNFDGESHWSGVSLTATRISGLEHQFVFATELPSSATANTTVLIATQGFADLGIVTPNYIVPSGFLFADG